MLELVYETHSTTVDNEAGNATGWLPGELSAAGRAQARELGARRRDVDAVFTSDLGRALETTAIAFGGRDLPIFHDWRLRECDYGVLNGAPAGELEMEKHLEAVRLARLGVQALTTTRRSTQSRKRPKREVTRSVTERDSRAVGEPLRRPRHWPGPR